MRILHLTREQGSDSRYGIGKSLLPVVVAMEQLGHQVDIHDGDRSEAESIHPLLCRVARVVGALLTARYVPAAAGHAAGMVIAEMVRQRVRIAWTGARAAASGRYTHVHCHDPVIAYAYAHMAPLFAARAEWGVTAHAYGAFVQERPGVVIPSAMLVRLQGWERWVVRRASWLCSPTRAGLDRLADEVLGEPYSADRPPFNRWHPVAHPKPAMTLYQREAARQQLGLSESERMVLSVGQLLPMKRFDLVIRACAALDRGYHLRLIILGDGDEGPLRQLAQQLHFSDRLTIAVTDDIALYLSAADYYVSASATESFGMANCEALAAGLPAICTAVGAVPAVVGDAAWLVDPSGDGIADALKRVLDDSGLSDRYARAASEWAAGWPGADHVAGVMEGIYRHRGRH